LKHVTKPPAAFRAEQRKFFRFPVEGEAMLFLLDEERAVCCRILDLGLEGCRLRKEDDVAANVGSRVEVAFRVAGSTFRFFGSLAWSAKKRTLGIQFQNMNALRRDELAELLAGMREELDAREQEKKAQEKQAGQQTPPQAADGPAAVVPAAQRKRERRKERRHTVDGYARIHLLSLHARMTGTIVDVSMGGCRIRTCDRFPVGAYRRVEVEFVVDGLPLLLPGVTQVIHDKWTVGVRFVELTARKCSQLQTVIQEINERNAGCPRSVCSDLG
jgi:hypothetical protein